MADVLPFAGTRFNTKENDLKLNEILCPPYDTIDPALQKELHEQNPNNMVRLTLGYEAPGDDEFNNRYTRAAECYREWKAKNLLIDEQRKCFYIYEHVFTLPGEKKKMRRLGFFALVKLQDYRSGKIRAHEVTFDEPKMDRLYLLKSSQVNTEPVFCLYKDEEKEINAILEKATQGKPLEETVEENGDTHRIWLMHRKDPILAINNAMKDKKLFIADGTDRYETALSYRDEMRESTGRRDGRQPYDFILMQLNAVTDEAVMTTSMHRVLARDLGADVDLEEVLEDLEEFFDIKQFKVSYKEVEKATETVEKHLAPKKGVKSQFVMALPGGRCYELKLKKDADVEEMVDEDFMSEFVKSQDVTILHKFIIARGWIGNPEVELAEDDINYCRTVLDALTLMKKRKGSVAFLINSMPKETVMEIAENGELLPHRSTYFYPKVKSGLILRDLQVGFG